MSGEEPSSCNDHGVLSCSTRADVEAVLLRCNGVVDVRVLAVPQPDDEDRVVAYVWPAGTDFALTEPDIRAWLSERLATDEIPGIISIVEPDLRDGELPPPWQPRPALGDECIPPRDETESRIARIWADILGLERVGIFDDFFALGGTSFLSVDLLARLASQGINVDARRLFENPTVAGIAAVVGDHPSGPARISS